MDWLNNLLNRAQKIVRNLEIEIETQKDSLNTLQDRHKYHLLKTLNIILNS